MRRIQPAHDNHHLPLRLHPRERAARAHAEEAGSRHAGKHAAFVVQPDQIAVIRRNLAGRAHRLNPFTRQDLFAIGGLAVIQQHLTDQGLVARADGHAAAPVRTARHRRHALAVDLDPGGVVAHPLPIFAGADGARDGFAEDVRQGFAEQVQQRIRQLVDADVVVFPIRARALQRPRIALLAVGWHAEGHGAIAVCLVRHAKAFAFPFARLLQKMAPGDVGVLAFVKANARHALAHGLVHVGQQATVMGHAGQNGQVQLGHAEGQVGALGLAPGRHRLAVHHHHARHRATVVNGAQQAVPGRRVVQVHAKVALDAAVPGGFVFIGEFNRLLHKRVHDFPSCCLCLA